MIKKRSLIRKGLILNKDHYKNLKKRCRKINEKLSEFSYEELYEYTISIAIPDENKIQKIDNFYLIPFVKSKRTNTDTARSFFNSIKDPLSHKTGIILHPIPENILETKQKISNYPWEYVEVRKPRSKKGEDDKEYAFESEMVFYVPPFIPIILEEDFSSEGDRV